MSDEVDVRIEEEPSLLESRRTVLLVPAVLATVLGGFLLVAGLGLWLLMLFVVSSDPGLVPQGAILIRPTTGERVQAVARIAVPFLVGVVLIVLTWRFRGQGRRVATCVSALGVVLMGLLCW